MGSVRAFDVYGVQAALRKCIGRLCTLAFAKAVEYTWGTCTRACAPRAALNEAAAKGGVTRADLPQGAHHARLAAAHGRVHDGAEVRGALHGITQTKHHNQQREYWWRHHHVAVVQTFPDDRGVERCSGCESCVQAVCGQMKGDRAEEMRGPR